MLSEELNELRGKIRKLGPYVFEETNFISYNGMQGPISHKASLIVMFLSKRART
jgi:hypothetical protein